MFGKKPDTCIKFSLILPGSQWWRVCALFLLYILLVVPSPAAGRADSLIMSERGQEKKYFVLSFRRLKCLDFIICQHVCIHLCTSARDLKSLCFWVYFACVCALVHGHCCRHRSPISPNATWQFWIRLLAIQGYSAHHRHTSLHTSWYLCANAHKYQPMPL